MILAGSWAAQSFPSRLTQGVWYQVFWLGALSPCLQQQLCLLLSSWQRKSLVAALKVGHDHLLPVVWVVWGGQQCTVAGQGSGAVVLVLLG
jgi:hypothetical protein